MPSSRSDFLFCRRLFPVFAGAWFPRTRVSRGHWLALAVALVPTVQGQDEEPRHQVRFAGERYESAPDTPFSATVVIDPVPAAGLFSFGVVATVQGGNNLVGLVNLSPRPALAFDGIGETSGRVPPGEETTEAKGCVDFLLSPMPAHRDPQIAELAIDALPEGTYTLSLRLHNTLGPTEAVFVDGQGRPLDGRLDFGSAVLEVIPPATVITSLASLTISLVPGTTSAAGDDVQLEWGTESGELYLLQYSEDLQNWKDVRSPVIGTGELLQWLDSGPPVTDSHPSTVPVRFYRFVEAEVTAP